MSTRTLTDRGLASQRTSVVGRRIRQGWWSTQPTPVGTSGSATVTASSTTNTKGAWAEIIASASSDADTVIVTVSGIGSSVVDSATLLDVGVGDAGAETVLIGDIGVGSAALVNGSALTFVVPIFIAKNTRLAARIQSKVSSRTGTVAVQLAKTATMSSRAKVKPVTFGANTATSDGTAMSANADTYIQVTASTTVPLSAIVMIPSASATVLTVLQHIYTLGVGPAGSEVELGTVTFNTNSTEQLWMNVGNGLTTVLSCDLPKGVRLAVKSTNGSTAYDVTLIGIPRVA